MDINMITPEQYLEAAKLLAKCRPDRLPMVIQLLESGGWNIKTTRSILASKKKIDVSDVPAAIEECQKLGYTQREIGEMTGIARPTITAFKTGARVPKGDNKERLVHALKSILSDDAWLEAKAEEEVDQTEAV